MPILHCSQATSCDNIIYYMFCFAMGQCQASTQSQSLIKFLSAQVTEHVSVTDRDTLFFLTPKLRQTQLLLPSTV